MRALGLLLALVALIAAACGGSSQMEEAAPPATTTTPADTTPPPDAANRPQAPAIEGVSLDGARVSLADFRGQPVFVNVWSSW